MKFGAAGELVAIPENRVTTNAVIEVACESLRKAA